ncbi:Protein Fam8A1 [Manis pentadactyla]|nr:Protein Fam8A1 [Manis pentadactyla]
MSQVPHMQDGSYMGGQSDTDTSPASTRFLVVPASSSSLFSHRIRFLLADYSPTNRLSALLKCVRLLNSCINSNQL